MVELVPNAAHGKLCGKVEALLDILEEEFVLGLDAAEDVFEQIDLGRGKKGEYMVVSSLVHG